MRDMAAGSRGSSAEVMEGIARMRDVKFCSDQQSFGKVIISQAGERFDVDVFALKL